MLLDCYVNYCGYRDYNTLDKWNKPDDVDKRIFLF